MMPIRKTKIKIEQVKLSAAGLQMSRPLLSYLPELSAGASLCHSGFVSFIYLEWKVFGLNPIFFPVCLYSASVEQSSF